MDKKRRKKAEALAKKVLEKIYKVALTSFDPKLVKDWKIEFADYIAERLTRDLITFKFDYCVWGHKIKEVENEWVEDYRKYPSNWWEALKDRWLPEWLKEKYPVKYDEIKTVIHRYQTFYNVYPKADDWVEGYLHKEIIKDIHKQ